MASGGYAITYIHGGLLSGGAVESIDKSNVWPPQTRLTSTRGQYLAFIDAYTRVNLGPPAEADIQRRFSVFPPSVHQMVLALERAGLIRRQPGRRAASM
jgi:hypothetical protein